MGGIIALHREAIVGHVNLDKSAAADAGMFAQGHRHCPGKFLGIGGVANVRQGKVFDLEVEGTDKKQAEAVLKETAEKLLANMVIENYRIEVVG